MEFSYTEEQDAVRELARQIFTDQTSHERSKELETSGTWYDDALWKELVQANFTALALPESLGGSGQGLTEVCILLEEQGRRCAPVPLLPTVVLGGLPIAEFGSEAQRKRWLVPVADSGAVLTAALSESGSSDPARPRTSATRDGDAFVLDGEKICVPAAEQAAVMVVTARTDDGDVVVLLVEPGIDGVSIERETVFHHEPQCRVTFSGTRVGADSLLGDPSQGRAIVDWLLQRAMLALSALQLGVTESAMEQTAAYITERKQFGKPIGMFQGPQLRIADAYIDVECLRSVLEQAVWRLSEGLRSAAEIRAARWWAARGGRRVVDAAQHLHGGIGADVDYPIHRHFLWAQQIGATFGGALPQLAALGELLVSDDERPTA